MDGQITNGIPESNGKATVPTDATGKDTSDKTSANLNQDRRAALKALAKYSGAIGAASLTVLTAEEALAKQPCSRHPQPQAGKNCDVK